MEARRLHQQNLIEAHIVGHLVRNRLVRDARREYEEIVCDLQSNEEAVPFSMEVAKWPTRTTLCYPVFVSEYGMNEGGTRASQSEQDCHHSQTQDTHTANVEHYTTSPGRDQYIDDRPNKESSSIKEECPLIEEEHSIVNKEDHLISKLPSDKQSLLELRAQLSMELLWIQQAITSRQNYLTLKKDVVRKTVNSKLTEEQ